MKVKSMTATFGCLNRAKLDLSGGLNILCAPNEAGKSTWAAFLRAMFYGIDTRDRDKKNYLGEKTRYQPWSGAAMEGEVQLEWQGREITLRRFRKGNAPFGGFSAVYTATGEPVPELTAVNCGQVLLGVGREIYERSAFIGHSGTLSITAAPELEQRIAALTSSGEEGVSYVQASQQLREWSNRRWVNRSVGRIPELEKQLEQIETSLTDLDQAAERCAQLERVRTEQARDIEKLAREKEIHRRLARRTLNQKYAQAKQAWEQTCGQLDELEQAGSRIKLDRTQLADAQGEIRYLHTLDEDMARLRAELKEEEEACPDAPPEKDVSRGEADADAVRDALRRANGLKKSALGLFLAAIALLAVGLGLQIAALGPIAVRGALLAFAGAAAVVAAVVFGSAGRRRTTAQMILTRWGVQNPEEIRTQVQEVRQQQQERDAAVQKVELLRETLNEQKTRWETRLAELMKLVRPFAPKVRTVDDCEAALDQALEWDRVVQLTREREQERRRRLDDLAAQGATELDTLEMLQPPARTEEETEQAWTRAAQQLKQTEAALNQARGRQKALGDRTVLAAQQENTERELEHRRQEYQAIGLAMQVLEQADSRLRERFSPVLNQKAGELLARMTEQRYTSLTLNREMQGNVTPSGELIPRNALALSQGTVDQLYLAVRLAIAQLCLPEKDRPPLVLDDALAAFDDDRMVRTLEVLRELAQEGQILLFTCQRREGDVLSGKPGVTCLQIPCNPEEKRV